MTTSFAGVSVIVKCADQMVKGWEIPKCLWKHTLLLGFGDEME